MIMIIILKEASDLEVFSRV